MKRRTAVVIAVVVAVVVAAAVPAVLLLQGRRDRAAQRDAAEAFATAWRSGSLARVAFAGGTGADVAEQAQRITADVTVGERDAPAAVEVTGVTEDGDTARATLSVRWPLRGGGTWAYETRLPLREAGGDWRPVWSPQVVHPQLAEGQVLDVERVTAPRGEILGAGDAVLVTERDVVTVGLAPNRTTDLPGSAAALAAVVDVDGAALAQRAGKAQKTAFVEAITLRRPAFEAVEGRLRPIPGVVFRSERRALAPTPTFARALLGSVGPATAEIVEEAKGRVRAGDLTGLSGLQRSFDERLAGTAGVTVRAVTPADQAGQDAAGDDAAGAEDGAATLYSTEPKAGESLRTTIDVRTQEAAEAALGAATKPAALVAVKPSTGEVLAVANGGPNAAGYNRALLGRYPPGSTFKVVSTLALLRDGLRPEEPVNCPPTLVVNGKTFRNAEGEVLGRVPFSTDFQHSCNTAFVGSAERISGEDLKAAGEALGFGRPAALGMTAFTGAVPATDDPVAHAAAMIGQGTVLASPLTVAATSAGVANGRWLPPKLVTDPAPDEAAEPGPELRAADVSALRTMMRSVVTGGTGTALKNVPGAPVSGKTGTAEYGSGDPPPTHAWFTGFQGDVAFAVVVEGGGFGGEVAAPLAADFLRRLAG